jgi:hypothetical protein
MGAGSMTGRGLGSCTNANAVNYGAGLGMGLGLGFRRGLGRGLGRGFVVNQTSSKTRRELLHQQKTMLHERLDVIDKQLDSL